MVLVASLLLDYFSYVSVLEEIERAVEKLPPEDFVRLATWMDQRRAEAAKQGLSQGSDWFDVYMNCPEPFEIPPRKKQFYTLG
jgi:hypothetical protein